MGYTHEDDGRAVFAEVLAEPLDGGDFVLRHARPDDLPHVLAVIDDVMRSRLMLPDELDVEMLAVFLLHGGALLVVDPETDLPLGGIRLFLHDDAIEFGYWLGPAARGRGIATRGLELVAARVVAELHPRRLELRTTMDNEPSERVAERAGFTLVGPEPPIEYPGGRVSLTNLWVRETAAGSVASRNAS
jgi:RimJ/RimL family protein N-acetyltransferase